MNRNADNHGAKWVALCARHCASRGGLTPTRPVSKWLRRNYGWTVRYARCRRKRRPRLG